MDNPTPEPLPPSSLGRRLVILLALAFFLLVVLAWMTIYLLDATGHIDIDPMTFIASSSDR
jgi:hypothetical protein